LTPHLRPGVITAIAVLVLDQASKFWLLHVFNIAGRGVVSVDNGVATLTEFGQNLLSWRGVSSETAHAFLGRAAKFGDVFKIRRELFEIAGLARTITWTGTDEQKQHLAEARTKVLETLREAKKTLHRVLGED